MATPKKKNKKWDSEATKQSAMEAVWTIMKENGFSDLEVMEITRRMGKSKGMIGYHYDNVNQLLKQWIEQKDYWPTLFQRFDLENPPGEDEVRKLFTELMQDNLKMFQATPEMQKIILWQITQERPLLRSVSDEREKEGAKLLALATPYFADSSVNFKAVIALLLGGSYYIVLHSQTNKSTVCGIDLNWEHDKDEVLNTISKIISWAWEKAQEKQAS